MWWPRDPETAAANVQGKPHLHVLFLSRQKAKKTWLHFWSAPPPTLQSYSQISHVLVLISLSVGVDNTQSLPHAHCFKLEKLKQGKHVNWMWALIYSVCPDFPSRQCFLTYVVFHHSSGDESSSQARSVCGRELLPWNTDILFLQWWMCMWHCAHLLL